MELNLQTNEIPYWLNGLLYTGVLTEFDLSKFCIFFVNYIFLGKIGYCNNLGNVKKKSMSGDR